MSLFYKAKSLIKSKKRTVKKKEVEKKKLTFLQRLYQYFLKRISKYKKSKAEKDLQDKIKKNLAKKKKKKNLQEEEVGLDSVSQISKLLQTYEEFIQRDFFMIIQEARAILRQWRSDLVSLISVKQEPDMNMLSSNLIEVRELYRYSGEMLDNFTHQCLEYQEVVKDTKRQISPQIKLNQVQFQLAKMRRGLEKGRELTDVELNQDYKYLSKYLNEHKGKGLSL